LFVGIWTSSIENNNLSPLYMSIHLHPNELIFHKEGNDIISAGFGINSILLSKGLSPILSFSNKVKEESEESDESIFKSFKNLAVPLGLFTTNKYNREMQEDKCEHQGTLSDSMFDKLMQMADYDKPEKPKSKKMRNKINNKSMRKHNKR
jgi:hypothetical protein